MANRLAKETSPYLQQHANNPVDWYPWGPEAFERAKAEDKPILLSIGYSSCHWCHVMAHESFEDPETAQIMNQHFINIKVDREERPDVDALYMTAVQMVTGQGGWPMTVFLTPEGKPFYGGTYFPPDDQPPMPGFKRILGALSQAYHQQRDQVDKTSGDLTKALNEQFEIQMPSRALSPELLDKAFENMMNAYDYEHGGLGGAPKFPAPMAIEFMLRYYRRTGNQEALKAVHQSLSAMGQGGIFDQVGGGFHRYTVDAVWLIPHFEKMLYDNALLAHAYTIAWQQTGEPFYRTIAEETIDYVLRELGSPDGGIYSSQDADTDGEEGKYYVWSRREIIEVLGDEDGRNVAAFLEATQTGNFEGKNVLSIPDESERMRWREEPYASFRAKLLEVRETRTAPGRDDKVLASWNGLMVKTLAHAAIAFEDDHYREAAIKCGRFIADSMMVDGRLFHSWAEGRLSNTSFLEDYAFVGEAFLELYELTFDPEWFKLSEHLADEAINLFFDASMSAFFDTAADADPLIARPRDAFDNVTPSGTSVMSDLLLRLSQFTGDVDARALASQVLSLHAAPAVEQAQGFARLLCAIDRQVGPTAELAIVGPDRNAFLEPLHKQFLPRLVVAASESPTDTPPILDNREAIEGKTTAYLCAGQHCELPTTDVETLLEQIQSILQPAGTDH